MDPHIFVSHPGEDAELADALASLLITGCGLANDQVFLSSRPGSGIPAGTDFKEYMRDQLGRTTLLVQLITPAYLDSTFCKFELGAAWVKGIDTFPLMVPPVEVAMLDDITGGVQAREITDRTGLDELMQHVARQSGANLDLRQWGRRRAAFIRRARTLASKVSKPRQVTAAALDSALARLRGAEANARFASGIAPLDLAFDKVRDGYDLLQLMERADPRDAVFLTQLRDATKHLAAAFGATTGEPCHVSIKWLDEPGEGVSTFDAWPIYDLVRSGRRRRPSTGDFVGNNSDFLQIMEGGSPYFADNDLRASYLEGSYLNSHWTDDAVEADKVDYRASIVVPIGSFRDDEWEAADVAGFLCIDSSARGAFDLELDVALARLVTNALYPVLDLYRQITSADEEG